MRSHSGLVVVLVLAAGSGPALNNDGEHKRQKSMNICGQTAAVSPGPSLGGGESDGKMRGAAEGSEDEGGRIPGSMSFPGLSRARQLWPWLSWENRWAGIQHSFQISQASRLPSFHVSRGYSSHRVTASCRGPRLKTVTAWPGTAIPCPL